MDEDRPGFWIPCLDSLAERSQENHLFLLSLGFFFCKIEIITTTMKNCRIKDNEAEMPTPEPDA